ncbi:MAG TPA: hypothetical protein VKF32_02145 [Thermoanaerobaculia bacterium]|nr:hypothetical protein [Thermoanaerobaculia bacterium]
MRRPSRALQSRIAESSPPLASVSPSGEKATATTACVCPRSVRTSAPVSMRQTFTAWSKLPLASAAPSGLNETDQTFKEWPWSLRSVAPSLGFQILIVLSSPPLARRPSLAKATVQTVPVWPFNVRAGDFSASGQSTTVPS